MLLKDCSDGHDRPKIKRFENGHPHTRSTATRPLHDASWTHHKLLRRTILEHTNGRVACFQHLALGMLMRVRIMVEVCHMKTWAATCASQQWKFACYIMSLPCEGWVRWQPIGGGRPAMNWTSKFEQLYRIKRSFIESNAGMIGTMWLRMRANGWRWMNS